MHFIDKCPSGAASSWKACFVFWIQKTSRVLRKGQDSIYVNTKLGSNLPVWSTCAGVELFASLGCLGWFAASRVFCMWQQHMCVAGKPAQPGFFQEETIWSLRRREQWEFRTWHLCANLENSRLWTNCVLIQHPKIRWPFCLSANDN